MFDESFWVMMATVLFLVLVFRPVARVMGRGLDKRAIKIRDELDEAQRLKEEAQAVLATYQRKQKKALEEAEEIIGQAKKQSEQLVKKAKQELEEELARRSELAKEKIAQAEASAIQDIRDNVVDITMDIAQKLVSENADDTAKEKMIKDLVPKLETKFH